MSQIDQDALDNVRALQRPGSPNILARIIAIYVDQAPESVEAILQAVAEQDFETIRTTAHSLKSSSTYVGANDFAARMANIEKAARDERIAICEQLSDGITEQCHKVVSELLYMKDRAA